MNERTAVHEAETNTFMVPDGFKIDSNSGVVRVDRDRKEKIERKFLFQEPVNNDEEAERLAKLYDVLDFFDRDNNFSGSGPDLANKISAVLLFDKYNSALQELGEDVTPQQIRELRRSMDLPIEDDIFMFVKRSYFGFFMDQQMSTVVAFIQDNPKFIAHITQLDGVSEQVKHGLSRVSNLLSPSGQISPVAKNERNVLTGMYEFRLDDAEISALKMEDLRSRFDKGMVHIPMLVPRFYRESLRLLPPAKKNIISVEVYKIAHFLQGEKKKAEKEAPQIVPIYQSLLQSIPRFYRISEQDFNEQLDFSPSEMTRARAEAAAGAEEFFEERRKSLRNQIRSLLNPNGRR